MSEKDSEVKLMTLTKSSGQILVSFLFCLYFYASYKDSPYLLKPFGGTMREKDFHYLNHDFF